MKKITFQLSIPEKGISKNREFEVEVKDDAILSQALAMVDKFIFEHPERSPFGQNHIYIRSYLQLFWDPEKNKIYDDINVFAAGGKGFMPIKSNIDYNIYDKSEISLTSSS